jgi:2-oxo-3-hexenedioate decarboxylase
MLPRFALTLSRTGNEVERGKGANVLGSPALALAHLARLIASRRESPLVAGEIISTGTLTDAWPVSPGEVWSSHYGELPLAGLTLRFT